jgi:hypothetical protein
MTLAFLIVLTQSSLRYQFSENMNVAFEVRHTHKTLDGKEETTTIETWEYTFAESLAGGAARLNLVRAKNGMIVDGQHYPIRAIPHKSKEERSPRGDARGREPTNTEEPTLELRMLRIGDIEYPAGEMKVGTEWTRQSQPTNDGLPAAKWTWKATALKDGKLSGTFSFNETGADKPIEAEGKFTVSTKDGWPIELTFKALNTHQLGDEEKLPTIYSYSLKRLN